MSIEYFYDENPPSSAHIKGKSSAYTVYGNKNGYVTLPRSSVVDYVDVPEFCQAVMKIAGKDVEHACAVDVGKRIVERLQKYIELHDGKTSDEFQDGVKAGYRTAMAVAHEESGYDL